MKCSQRYKNSYQNFMKNIALIARLWKHIFFGFCKVFYIRPSVELNMFDATLLKQKKPESITFRDWKNGNVTIRNKKNICGRKILLFVSMEGCITFVELININFSEQEKEIRS